MKTVCLIWSFAVAAWFKTCTQTFPNWHGCRTPEDWPQDKFCTSWNWVYIWSAVLNVYTVEFSWNPNSKTLEPDQPKHDHPTTCVITQHYSAIFVLLLSYLQGKIWHIFLKKSNFFLLKLLSLKSHKLSFRKSGSVCPVSTSWTVGSYVRAWMRPSVFLFWYCPV